MDLQSYRQAFDEAERDFEAAVEEYGLPFEREETSLREARVRTAASCGCRCENGASSLWRNWISPACLACRTGDETATFFVDLRCVKKCYFCFNPNQDHYEHFLSHERDIVAELEQAHAMGARFRCLAITGGEPLLHPEQVNAFLQRAAQLYPDAHTRLYTCGDLLDERGLQELAESGLDEIRFSIKPPDASDGQDRVYELMEQAVGTIPSVVVEVPVIPGSLGQMKDLLVRSDALGISGVNLLEFCFPFCNWDEFARRGLTLKNPPFEVMYDYGYSGGLAVAGSEELALELMLWALDEDLGFGMHYCSLENKHRSEMRQKNERAAHAHPCVAFDEGDFFLKTAKAFGPDVKPVRTALEAKGCTDFMEDPEEGSLAFPPRFLETARSVRHPDGEPVQLQRCFLVYETGEDGGYLIDVALRPA